MTIARFTRQAGDQASQGSEDPSMVLIGDVGPNDFVYPPRDSGLPPQLRILAVRQAPCPLCARSGNEVPVKHFELETNAGVAECRTHGFLWYRRRA